MADTLAHRGPDDHGTWADDAAGIALGHRRLAVVDVSIAGRQPMHSTSGRMVLAYNGEIYNHRELRAELASAGCVFRSRCDTEVLVEACEYWGVEETLQRLVGMFAFALWDRQARTLWLARDRIGIKPLYWGWARGVFLFGSELKALRVHPSWSGEIDREALACYLRYGYVPAPASIYRGVHKLEPGHLLRLGPEGSDPQVRAWWSLRQIVGAGITAKPEVGDSEAVERLDELLRDAVGCRMLADVPLGAFLSGGVDSSTVVALMQAQSARPVRTFSIGFHEGDYDEAVHARRVAAHLGTDHTELYVEPADALAVIPRLPAMFDEPLADSSQIPTFLVAELTRRHVTVALSGDGGDEVFAGYDRYRVARALRRWVDPVPAPLRSALAASLRGVSAATSSGWLRAVPQRMRPPRLGERLEKLARAVAARADERYDSVVSHWPTPPDVIRTGREHPLSPSWCDLEPQCPDSVERMRLLDTLTYLPGDILTKVDRATMAVSLEARVPLLDHRVVEFSWALPSRTRLRSGTSKWLLRQVLYRYVPRDLVDRPKMGFGIPLGMWLRGPLRGWADDLLSPQRLREDGFLEPKAIRSAWQEHLTGRYDRHFPLWNVLMFQAWLETERRRPNVGFGSTRLPTGGGIGLHAV